MCHRTLLGFIGLGDPDTVQQQSTHIQGWVANTWDGWVKILLA